MTTSTGLAPQSQKKMVAEPSPSIATKPTHSANCTWPVAHAIVPEGQCSFRVALSVAEETGPYLPSELVTATQQPNPAVINRRPWHTMKAAASPPPALLRCSYKYCVRIEFCPYASSTINALAVKDNTEHSCTVGCQLHPQWTTAPVQESLSGYNGPSALVWMVTDLYCACNCRHKCPPSPSSYQSRSFCL